MVTVFIQMAQLHLEDDYVMAVKDEAVDSVTVTMKAQARTQDFEISERSFS
jgi:hypothetical protein